jgi:hypothetical protein
MVGNPSPGFMAAGHAKLIFLLGFLAVSKQLHRHNDREWFQHNKAHYESQLREPFFA